MTPCEYLKGLDFLLNDLHHQLRKNYSLAKSPDQYGYVLLYQNLLEIDIVLSIAEALGLREWLKNRNTDVMYDIYNAEEEFLDSVIFASDPSSSSILIEDMFMSYERVTDAIVSFASKNRDRIYDLETFWYVLTKLAALWWGISYSSAAADGILEMIVDADE